MPVRLHAFDLGVVALYLVAITLFGLRFSRKDSAAAKDKSLRGYFLAGRTIPWWAIALSIVSAETSTLTVISIPGVAYAGDFGFLQIVLGYMIGRIVVAALFLPKYFHGEMLTAYQLIDRRFGHTLHKVTAGLFLITRAAAEGVRVFAVSIVVGIAIGTGDVLSIGLISLLTLLYTFEGGMAAVIWTDVVQMAIYVAGTVVAIATLGTHVPGGWSHIHTAASAAGKFHTFNFALNLTQSYTFWAGILGGTFLTMASHGTDQLMVQRMLAAKNLRESRLALLSSGVVIFMQFTLFLLIGAGLWVFYGAGAPHLASEMWVSTTTPDRLFPTFIVREMPIGVAGLLVAAILAAAMSNLSAALNSLSSTTVVDFYMTWRPAAGDRERMLLSRASTVLWACILFAIAVYSIQVGGKGHVVELGLSIASVAYGCLLGVFLLGTLTRYATQWGSIVGMVCGFALNLTLWLQSIHILPNPTHLPTIAFTWYVLIGALVTFAIGSLASLILPKPAVKPVLVTALLLAAVAASSSAQSPGPATRPGGPSFAPSAKGGLSGEARPLSPTYNFTPVSDAITTAIAQKKLPGAVVLIGHNGKVVFEQAYGLRKLYGEPGLDGKPAPAEPMTEDTIFDMASLTKCLATATAIMQLYDAGKLAFDDPVATYLPDFAANGKDKVTIRMLLTHYSGLPPDVDLRDPWGLAAPDKAEGIRRAMNTKLDSAPGTKFVYSDINFITLGVLVEKLSGERLDVYAQRHIFQPLGMAHTQYHAVDKTCGPAIVVGANVEPGPKPIGRILVQCPVGTWGPYGLDPDTAPTAHDDELKSDPKLNPDFDHLLRGTVHDPTTRRMGGVAGHAGVFSTAADMALYAQALLDKLLHNTGPFPVSQATLRLMTMPEQPISALPGATIFTPDGKPTTGIAARGFGWDINTAFSRPRGASFPIGSFGHTGFTGTSIWMDPYNNSFVILLANAIHPRGNPPISALRGEVATAAAHALGFYSPDCAPCPANSICDCMHVEPTEIATVSTESTGFISKSNQTLTGIDVLESTHFAALTAVAAKHAGHLRLGLLTNQTGLDAQGHRTIDILLHSLPEVQLTTLFSPEHGIAGAKDSETIGHETDPISHLPVITLYGAKDSDRRPTHEALANLDAVVIDLQDAGVRFYTYETVLGYFLEAAACESAAHHALDIIVLDRPPLLGGLAVQGPVSDAPAAYINYMPMPIRHGMTFGELARYERAGHPATCPGTSAPVTLPATQLTIVAMRNWTRAEFFDQTGLPWTNPSPNLRSLEAAFPYPGVGMFDATTVSVGRGSATPFEQIAAPWLNAAETAAYLTARNIPGITFTATTLAIAEDTNHYPGHGQTLPAVHFTVTDRDALDSPELGIEVISALHHLYPTQWKLSATTNLIANTATQAALERGDDPRTIAATWQPALDAFKSRRAQYLLYP